MNGSEASIADVLASEQYRPVLIGLAVTWACIYWIIKKGVLRVGKVVMLTDGDKADGDLVISADDLTELDHRRIYLRIHHDEDAEVYLNGSLVASLAGHTAGYRQRAL